eukprot:TRINITY_DN18361_c0_g1_i1.p1 TRINITY_DN18361_c0_g1~~TRINITY_DN18361_c0_g1_i1.p1  ORF type:complete len:257 (+),score=60.88 TRINITY_DN18361_c0_g1_i1:56-772(+)
MRAARRVTRLSGARNRGCVSAVRNFSKRSPKELLENNRVWSEETAKHDPEFFRGLSGGQKPSFLWVGCSDSRVSTDVVTGTKPGEIFVHRNIANMVVHTDMNLLSVLQYAVDHLKVPNVVVCGHYGCGGVAASMTKDSHGIVDNWLRNIKDVSRYYKTELDAIQDPKKRFDRLVELNVREQVRNVCRTNIIEDAWARGQQVAIHGWVYRLEDGRLTDLNTTITSREEAHRHTPPRVAV